MDSICVIGAGKWGSALHFALSQNQQCFITNRTKKDIKNFIPLKEALECKYLIIAIPSQFIRAWLEENFIFKNQKILVAAKGIEANSGAFYKKFMNSMYQKKILVLYLGHLLLVRL